jgi:hypothetical protein
VAGAALKTDYLEAIEAAGFQDIAVIDESSFPLDCIFNDPSAQAIIRDLNASPEMMTDMAGSIVSVKISAVKQG